MLMLTTLLAGLVPRRRALRVEPLEVLPSEQAKPW